VTRRRKHDHSRHLLRKPHLEGLAVHAEGVSDALLAHLRSAEGHARKTLYVTCGTLIKRGFQTAPPRRCSKPATHEVFAPSPEIVHFTACEKHANQHAERYFKSGGVVVRELAS
jgi:hypothetical protein